MKATLLELFDRDLLKLKEELSLYADEADIWKIEGDILNPAGTLALHLAGNLQHFVGTLLGKTGYVRNRDAEFSLRDVSRVDLLAEIDQARAVVTATISALKEEDFARNFPVEKHGRTISTTHMLLHLLSHLGYHLGQVNYHRRLVGA